MPPRIPPNTGTATGPAKLPNIDPSKFSVALPDYWPGELIVKVAPDALRPLSITNPTVLPESILQMLVWLLENYGLRRASTLWYSGATLVRTAGVPPAAIPTGILTKLQKLGDRLNSNPPPPGESFPNELAQESLSLLRIWCDPEKPLDSAAMNTVQATAGVVYAEQIPYRFLDPISATSDTPPFTTDPGAKMASPDQAYWGRNQAQRPSTWDTATPNNIVVIDSGCEASHPAFANRFSAPVDKSGHGTTVCGILAAKAAAAPSDKAATIWDVPAGLLPKTSLKVLNLINNDPATREWSDGELTWVIDPSAYATSLNTARTLSGIRVANFSNGYGARKYKTEKDDFQKLENAKISVVASCGNLPKMQTTGAVLYPAVYDTVISVGALAYDPTFTYVNPAFWPRTRWGLPAGETRTNTTGVDILAPGDQILSPRLQNADTFPYCSWNGGTSLATPFVTAVVAMMYKANSSLTPKNIRDAIKTKLTPRKIGGRSVRLLDCGKLV